MIVLHSITVVCPRLLTVGDFVVLFVCFSFLFNSVRCPCNVFDMIVSPQSVHCYLLTAIGQRSFAVNGPRTWNSLPADLRTSDTTLCSFKRHLKTHLLQQ